MDWWPFRKPKPDDSRFWELRDRLLKRLPPRHPVFVEIAESESDLETDHALGECLYREDDGPHYVIRVLRRDKYTMEDSLVHEYAHVLDHVTGDPMADHGPTWGVRYSEVYRVSVE